ncbi:hypothetical protein N7528_009092 [Penicillium herquei]|nr:hypothetical protein N7528_009092 [Penicillium herquei]
MEFRDDVKDIRSRWVLRSAIAPRTLWTQTWTAICRHYQLIWGDKRTFITLVIFNILNAVINGSSYYMAPKDVTGSYEKSSALFFSLIYFYLNALTEATSTVRSRSILLKQVQYGLIHPSAFITAQTLAEIPISFFQSLLFACLYYWQIDLQRAASAFWIFVLIVFTHYSAVQSLFRALGAWSPNISLTLMMAGSAIPVGLLYSGFGPTRPTQHRWGSWLRRTSPSPWALEALMGNEFTGITLTCSDSDMVPSGPGYNNSAYQTCSITGSGIGQESVAAPFTFRTTLASLGRISGAILASFSFYVIGCIGLTVMTRDSSNSVSRVFKRSKKSDIESQPRSSASSATDALPGTNSTTDDGEPTNSTTFTFQDICYFVPVGGQDKQLLHDVSGYARPGQLTALMGASGAGKTTLLDTLSQRKSTGTINGSFLLNGKPLDDTFARSCGFVMQQDIHEPNATIREALEFSADMRQPANVPREEKRAYVEHIIHLLDLENIAKALIGVPGDGQLSVEERKRVTIGVELAARPSSLLFLDEPTSGLDSQAAFSLIEFLQKIAAEGIPIICTIHQPSGVLFDMFDHVLLLAPGGRTVYFGETGNNSSKVVDYFGRHGAVIGEDVNPAEFILSNSTMKGDQSIDWPAVWDASDERKRLYANIEEINRGTGEDPNVLSEKADPENPSSKGRYALPLWAQTLAVTKRHWISVWRDGSYNFSRMAKSLFVEIFIAFSFFKAGSSIQGLQNSIIAVLLLSWIIPSTCADLQDMWFRKWDLFTAREKNGIYDWKALVTALIAVELPWQLGTYSLVFLSTYWTVGFPNIPAIAGFNYFTWLLLAIFGTGYSQLLAAMFPNPLMGGYANSLFWVILMVFSGTCATYAQRFLESSAGYLVNGNDTQDCAYCEYTTGDDYTATLDYTYGQHWWNWAVFLGFCLTNFALIYVVMYWTKGRLQRSV